MVTTNAALKKRTRCHILKSLFLNGREHRESRGLGIKLRFKVHTVRQAMHYLNYVINKNKH